MNPPVSLGEFIKDILGEIRKTCFMDFGLFYKNNKGVCKVLNGDPVCLRITISA